LTSGQPNSAVTTSPARAATIQQTSHHLHSSEKGLHRHTVQHTRLVDGIHRTTTQINSFGSRPGPLLGLIGTTARGHDTLVGDPSLGLLIAETYLKPVGSPQRRWPWRCALGCESRNEHDDAPQLCLPLIPGNTSGVNDNGQAARGFQVVSCHPHVGSFLAPQPKEIRPAKCAR